MKKEEYTKNLENIIKQMLTPLRRVPFGLVIEGLSGFRVVPYNNKSKKDKKVLKTLTDIAKIAGSKVNKKGILRPRPNEVGNDIENFVKNALNSVGYKCEAPKTKKGLSKTTGYPDLQFVDEFGRINYLECKTFNIKNVNTTQRSFYLSPSEQFKVTEDAHHFVLSYEVYIDGRKQSKNKYKCKSWKILSIENLEVDVKYEFNSDNARLYAKELILAEGSLD